MKLEEYRKKLQDQLNGLSAQMKKKDIDRVQSNLTKVQTISELDAISLGLNFHQFRVANRENSQ